MSKTITVSDKVYEELEGKKEEEDHQTFDSAIRKVLREAGYEDY